MRNEECLDSIEQEQGGAKEASVTDTIIHPTLYRRDSRGSVRTWHAEQQGPAYRIVSGQIGGKTVATGWTQCEGKQGRNDEEQAAFEVDSAYRYHRARDYHDDVAATETARFFKPMLASKYDTFAPGYAQPKLDGVRCIATEAGLWTREGQPISGAPHIFAALASVFDAHPYAIIDGELYNHALAEDFNEIISLVRKKAPDDAHRARSAGIVEYHVYDLPSAGGSFADRHAMLTELVGSVSGIVVVETRPVADETAYDELHGGWLAAGYEGSMWRADLPYEQKRSKTLRKRKSFQDAEFECVAIEEGNGTWAGLAKSVTCRLADGRTFSAGVKGSQAFARQLLGETHRVVTVQYFHLTPDGVPRFPVAVKFWGETRDA